MEINRICPDEHNFTQRLASIANPPKSLCFMGTLPTSGAPVVAIVGSRKPSAYGREVTEQLASDLAKAGYIIVSGLALGIDGIAQKAALEAGGTVIGVIPNELPDISPQTNYKLAMNIIENGGAILSEWKKGDGKIVNRWSFLERNRLVSGLADAVIITEAAERSGTLNTAATPCPKAVTSLPCQATSPAHCLPAATRCSNKAPSSPPPPQTSSTSSPHQPLNPPLTKPPSPSVKPRPKTPSLTCSELASETATNYSNNPASTQPTSPRR